MATVWKPLDCFVEKSETRTALLLLNQPNSYNKSFLTNLWKKALFRVSVDGGTNHLYNAFKDEAAAYLPDLITGDFDSIHDSVKKFYQDKGVEIVETPDQNHTDFTKAIMEISKRIKDQQINNITVYGSFEGRLDHVFANVNSLFEASHYTRANVMHFSEDTVAFLLQTGMHQIMVDPGLCGQWCGLIPVGEPCHCVTTQGLKWNLGIPSLYKLYDHRNPTESPDTLPVYINSKTNSNNSKTPWSDRIPEKGSMRFGELISTSNTLSSDAVKSVTVETDKPLLWTMGIAVSKVSETAGLHLAADQRLTLK